MAVRLVDFSDPTAVRAFWGNKLPRLANITTQHAALAAQWIDIRLNELAPLKSVTVLAPTCLVSRFGLGVLRWIKQLVLGFPIVGALFQDSTYPVNTKVELPSLGPSDISPSSQRRFIERSGGWDPLPMGSGPKI